MIFEVIFLMYEITFKPNRAGIERFFIKVSKSNWFCIITLHDWLTKTRATFSSNQK